MEDDFAPREKTQTTNKVLFAALVTLALSGAGLYVFVGGVPWFEPGQYVLILLFLGILALLFFSIFRMKIPLAGLAILLGVATLYAAQEKLAWRRAYLDNGIAGKAFVLDPYIRDYPSLESYLAAPWLGLPDWVRLARECVEPVRSGLAPDEDCASLPAIEGKYHIDIKSELLSYRARMARTADQIAKGKLTKKKDYQSCVARKDCAEVPLLPKDVDPDSIDPESNDYLPVRRMFWQLTNEKTMTPELCASIVLCAALTKTGAISDAKF